MQAQDICTTRNLHGIEPRSKGKGKCSV